MLSKPVVLAAVMAMGLGVMWTDIAAAQDASSTGGVVDPDAKAKKKDPNRRVCRNVVISGTRLSERHCRSAADWERDAERAQRDVQEGQVEGSRRDGEMNGQGRL